MLLENILEFRITIDCEQILFLHEVSRVYAVARRCWDSSNSLWSTDELAVCKGNMMGIDVRQPTEQLVRIELTMK